MRVQVHHAPRLQPPPVRNPSIVGALVYSHGGKFGVVARDVRNSGFPLDLELFRSSRSGLAPGIAELGRGRTCTLAQHVEPSGEDVLSHDGQGGLHRFARTGDGAFAIPQGLYAVLRATDGAIVRDQRYGVRRTFRPLEEGRHPDYIGGGTATQMPSPGELETPGVTGGGGDTMGRHWP